MPQIKLKTNRFKNFQAIDCFPETSFSSKNKIKVVKPLKQFSKHAPKSL